MTGKQFKFNKRTVIRNRIIISISIIGLMICIAVLFPQIRRMIMDLVEQIVRREIPISTYQSWFGAFLSYAMGGICLILFFDYCTLTESGRMLVHNVKQEIKDCLSEIDFRSLLKPILLLSGIYLLGILTIVRANFLYLNDLKRSVDGSGGWHGWSRYVLEFSSVFVHGDTNLTDISPVPQLLAVLILSISSVLLVYVIGNKKITTVRLLASIPLGLSPFFLECLAFKYDAPYMALSILACIVPFLFVARRKAFIFCSVVVLLIMCMTYQAVSGIYPVIAVILCFQDWNSRKKTYKEILSFLGIAALAFCFTMLLFRIFLMKPADTYASTSMYPAAHILSGTLSNIKDYVMTINHDLGLIWKIGIVLVLLFFITKSMHQSAQKKAVSFFVSILIIGISFVLSYGVYLVLTMPLYVPRGLIGFGVFLAVLCIYVVSDYKKSAIVAVFALNWCLFVFAFSYGNALADQKRYAEFRLGIMLHDLSALDSNRNKGVIIKNAIDFAPTIKNIAKHYPVIEKLVPKLLGDDSFWDWYYFDRHFNFNHIETENRTIDDASDEYNNIDVSDSPVVLDSYYHTIQSDGKRILVILKH